MGFISKLTLLQKILICSAVVLLAAGGVFFALRAKSGTEDETAITPPQIETAIDESIEEDEPDAFDPSAFLIEKIAGLTDEAIDKLINLSFEASEIEIRGKLDVLLSVSAGEGANEKIAEAFPALGEFDGLTEIILASGLALEIFYDAGGGEARASADAGWLLGGEEILAADAVLENGALFARIPALYDKYIVFEIGEMISGGTTEADAGNPDQFNKFLNLIGERDSEVKGLINSAVAAAVSQIEINYEAGVFEMKPTKEEITAAYEAVLSSIVESDARLELITDLANLAGEEQKSKDEIKKSIEDLLSNSDLNLHEDFEAPQIIIYLSEESEAINGFKIEAEHFNLEIISEAPGEFEINFSAEDFLPEEISGGFYELLRGAGFKLSLSVYEGGFDLSVEAENPSEEISVSLSISSQKDARINFSAPDPDEAVAFENLTQSLGLDVFRLIGNVTKLLSEIDALGYDTSFAYDLILGLILGF